MIVLFANNLIFVFVILCSRLLHRRSDIVVDFNTWVRALSTFQVVIDDTISPREYDAPEYHGYFVDILD